MYRSKRGVAVFVKMKYEAEGGNRLHDICLPINYEVTRARFFLLV
jgi:hypothetical protein